jgi:hypothetical protein
MLAGRRFPCPTKRRRSFPSRCSGNAPRNGSEERRPDANPALLPCASGRARCYCLGFAAAYWQLLQSLHGVLASVLECGQQPALIVLIRKPCGIAFGRVSLRAVGVVWGLFLFAEQSLYDHQIFGDSHLRTNGRRPMYMLYGTFSTPRSTSGIRKIGKAKQGCGSSQTATEASRPAARSQRQGLSRAR